MKVWIATWHDTGSVETAIIGVYSDQRKAEQGIVDYHMDSEDCEANEWEVQ